jgi:hypothetical protein
MSKHAEKFPNSFTAFLETECSEGWGYEGERVFPESLIGLYLQWFLDREKNEVSRLCSQLNALTKERDDYLSKFETAVNKVHEWQLKWDEARKETLAWKNVVSHIPLHNYPDARALVLQALAQFPEKEENK